TSSSAVMIIKIIVIALENRDTCALVEARARAHGVPHMHGKDKC
ncbi:hypothetical protein ALC57_14416, partial [Trachymyrmex cornetzi]